MQSEAKDKFNQVIEAIFPRDEVYCRVDEYGIVIDGQLTLQQLGLVHEAYRIYIEEAGVTELTIDYE